MVKFVSNDKRTVALLRGISGYVELRVYLTLKIHDYKSISNKLYLKSILFEKKNKGNEF